MRVQIVGLGVVGTAQAYLAWRLGHEVLGYDPGKAQSEYARMTGNPEAEVDLNFVCVPEKSVEDAVRMLGEAGVKGAYVIKSTVPPGTTCGLREKYGPHISHNPEFLTEKTALENVVHPRFVVISPCCDVHRTSLEEFYRPLKCPVVFTEPATSETLKLAINAYLATMITFWNEIDEFARRQGLSTAEIAGIATVDPRISKYGTEFFGAPFGGKCLPKDLDQLIRAFGDAGLNPMLLMAVRDFNDRLKNADGV